MDLRGTSLLATYATMDEALRWALVRMAEASGLSRYLLAPQVDLSPSHFSKALNPNKSDDDAERRHHFPADRVARYIEVTGDGSFLFTLLDALGYDWIRLKEIRRPNKTQAQLLEDIADRLGARQKEDQAIRDQLKLVMQEAGTAKGKKR